MPNLEAAAAAEVDVGLDGMSRRGGQKGEIVAGAVGDDLHHDGC